MSDEEKKDNDERINEDYYSIVGALDRPSLLKESIQKGDDMEI